MKRIVRHSVVLGAFAILSSLSFPAFADSSSTVELEFTFASTLTTTLSSADIFIHDITPGTSKNSNSVNLNVTTNNITGYVVSASTGDANNNSSDLIQTGITDKFSSIAASANLESLTTDDTWGYSTKVDTTSGNGTSEQTVRTEGTWSNLNGLATTSAPIYSTNSPIIADVNFRIAARASEDIEPGEYTNTINFFVVVNPAPVTFSDAFAGAGKTKLNNYYKMQDMSPSICNAVIGGAQTQLIDARDNSVYYIGKLADGNCWFKDNLALDLTDSTILNGLDANNTNADATTLGYLKGTTMRDPATDPDGNYATAGVANWTSSYSYSAPLVNMTNKDVVPQGSSDPLAAEALAEGWKVGGYYNYCAASAGSYCYGNGSSEGSPSGNATADICPSGWRMPTGGASGEYQTLANAITGGTSAYISTEPEYSNIRNALRLPLSGYFDGGTQHSQGANGYFWSSTYGDSLYMNVLYVGTSFIEPQAYYDLGYRSSGYSVRCIARNGAEPGTFNRAFADANKTKATASDGKQYYQMQDMTSSICGAITTGQTSQLVDTRDGTVYHVGKLADNRCWLLDNLALDLTTSGASTNITASNTNADATSLNTLFNGGGTASDQYATAGVANWTSGSSYSAPLVNMASKDTTRADLASPSDPLTEADDWKFGGYYNFCAASAGSYCYGNGTSSGSPSGNASSDICPSGWRMPTSGAGGEYRAIYNEYSGTSGYANFRKALRLPLSGGFTDGVSSEQGSLGVFWSSTLDSSSDMLFLYVDTSYIELLGGVDRSVGNSVRCMAQ